MLSVEVIEHLRREEERRREQQAPVLRVPVDEPRDRPMPEESAQAEEAQSTIVIVDVSRDDGEQFRIATW